MVKKILCVTLTVCLFTVLNLQKASAGVEPSPIKVYLVQTIDQITHRLEVMAPDQAGEIIAHLKAIANQGRNMTNAVIARNALGVMDRITSVFFDSQPEPPGLFRGELLNLVPEVLIALDQVIALGFETPPKMHSLAIDASRLMDRLISRAFDPQPEPPGYEIVASGIRTITGISGLTIDVMPQEQVEAKRIIRILSQVGAVLFDPQPEPPGVFALPMLDILNDMRDLYQALFLPVAGR